MNGMKTTLQPATLCARAGSESHRSGANEPVQPPIVQSAIFDLGGTEDAEAIFSGARKGYAYSRFGNPTVDTLAGVLAGLEGGAEALVTSSGNAAALCAVTMAMHGRSGPVLTPPDIYGGSFELLRILGSAYRLPLETADPSDSSAWLAAVARAGVVLLETPSNPVMRLIDLAETITRARQAGVPVIVDNTVATPLGQRPLEMGADWVIHSTTKYLNGHGDLIGGCVVGREPMTRMHRSIHKNLGGTVNAFEAWLTLRGLRTFALRMERHEANARAIAEWLSGRPEIAAVHYPGLASHPQASLFRRQMRSAGGLLSFEFSGGEAAAARFINGLKLVIHAVSLGGPETLVTVPARSSHRGMTPEARRSGGISDGLVRLSAGLESIDDLLEDMSRAIVGC